MFDMPISTITAERAGRSGVLSPEALNRLLQPLISGPERVRPDETVSLRLLVLPDTSNGHYRTISRRVIRAVGSKLKESGIQPLLAPTALFCNEPLRVILNRSGLEELARTEGFDLVDYDHSYSRTVPVGRQEYRLREGGERLDRSIWLTFTFGDPLGHFNGVLASLVGLQAGRKQDWRYFGEPSPKQRGEIAADLLSLGGPDLCLVEVDSVGGRNEGTLLFTSEDPVALDSYLGQMSRCDEIAAVAAVAASAGLGNRYPEAVVLNGEAGRVNKGRFDSGKSIFEGLLRRLVWRVLSPFGAAVPEINTSSCDGCCKCVDACHSGALIAVGRGTPVLDQSECCSCFSCCESCPQSTIFVRRNQAGIWLDSSWRRNCAV